MEVFGETVVSGCDAAEVLEATEHALDSVAMAIKVWGEAAFPDAVGFRRDVRRRSLGLDLPTYGIGIITLVAMDEIGRGHLVEQRVGSHAVSHLAARQQERDGAAEAISQSVDFCRPPAARPADRLVLLPPFPPDAQR